MKRRRRITDSSALPLAIAMMLYASGCGGGAPATGSDAEPPPETIEDPVIDAPLVAEATQGEADGVRYIELPTTECANLTATPIVVGDWLVYPMHEHGHGCSPNSAWQRTLFGYNFRDGRLYSLYEGAAGEAPLLYDAGEDVVYWTTTFGGTVHLLDPRTFELRTKMSVGTTADSSGTLLDGLYHFGTVNTPDENCQEPINPGCGALVSVDSTGEVVRQIDIDDGFRAWIGTGVTTDGESLFFGSAAQTAGEKTGDETEYLYGCSVIKTDRELGVVASFDPGDLACFQQPFEGANMDSVAGEVVPDATGLWVQYVRPNDAGLRTALYRLTLDLEERCRVEFDFEPQTQAVGFYGGPTVDKDGNAYVSISVPDDEHTRRGKLLRVTPDCEATTLAEAPGSWAQASPTLADDEFVLFATDGRLQVLTLEGAVAGEYPLGSSARVLASPIVHGGTVYVVQEDATLNILEETGLRGYGSAPWPRYRGDNAGRAGLG